MNGKDILEGLGYVDEQFVQEAENKRLSKKKKIIKFAVPIAASFALLALSYGIYRNGSSITPTNPNSDSSSMDGSEGSDQMNTTSEYKLEFNKVDLVSADRAIKGYFFYELNAEQIEHCFSILSQKYDMEGTVHYSSVGDTASLYEVTTNVTVGKHITGKITVAPNEIVKDCVVVGTPKSSNIEGVPIEAGMLITDKNSKGEKNYIYYAEFKMDTVCYYLEFVSENKEAEVTFTNIVADVILGGKAELSILENPVVPTIIENDLTKSEAYGDQEFGKYLITIPSKYTFNCAYRLLNQTSDFLDVLWSNGYEDIILQVSRINEDSKARIVLPEDTKLYDMSLYPIPWVESMPEEQAYIIENPVFKIEELTLDMIQVREVRNGERDNGSGSIDMNFSVLYGDVVVEVRSQGLSAEYLYEELKALVSKLDTYS